MKEAENVYLLKVEGEMKHGDFSYGLETSCVYFLG